MPRFDNVACIFTPYRAGDGMNVLPKHIESGAAKMIAEFAEMGIDIKPMLKTKTFMYNEFGMGGGLSECGDSPGKTWVPILLSQSHSIASAAHGPMV